MSAIKFFLVSCSFAFLAACSSTPEPQVESTKSAIADKPEVKQETLEKEVIVDAVEYSGVEVLSSCLHYVVIRDDEFVGYQPRYFDFDATIATIATGKSDKQMSCVAGLLKDYPEQVVEVRGYTDNKGSEAYNLLLSEKRSASIMSELIKLGVSAEQLSNVAVGEAEPLNENKTDEERALNRRVEFVLAD